MRRTYRSKKDTGGGLDHRDMVLSVDAKSSVFDAFYIQNIKQVKREMSCVSSTNPYSAASNKVRKRKYVKRLKEPEPNRESTDSTYLTPDKSIRVNKAPDLFDQILNSSTNVSFPKSGTNFLNNVQQPKVYTHCRKKLKKVKKFNYSDSDFSDSDKENSFSDESNLSSNCSNIKAHKLVIEPERVSSPENLDDSIKKIVKNLPVLSKLSKENGNDTPNRSNRFSSILFNVTESSMVVNSPQCSTPFLEKHRGKSIYRFSPIRIDMNNTDISLEDENKINNSIDSIDSIVSNNKDSIMVQKDESNIIEGNSVIRISGELMDINENKEREGSCMEKYESTNSNHTTTSNNSTKNKQFLSNVTSSLQITDCEPFLGFSKENSAEYVENHLVNLRHYKQILGETSYVDENVDCSEIREKTDSQLIENYNFNVSKCTDKNSNVHLDLEDTATVLSEASESVENNSEDGESASMYNTCDSDNLSDSLLSDKVQNKEAIVVVEKMSDSLFQKYFRKNSSSSNDNSTNNVSDERDVSNYIYESDQSTSEKEENNIFSNSFIMDTHNQSDKLSSENLVHTNTSSSENDNSYSSEVAEEEKFVSFVTTRRRIEISNNSFLLSLDNSNGSASSPSLNKTVLTNSKLENSNNIDNDTLVNIYVEDSIGNVDKEKTEEAIVTANVNDMDMPMTSKEDESFKQFDPVHDTLNEDYANINMRKDSKTFRNSVAIKDSESEAYIDPDHQFSNEELTNINTRRSSRMLRESIRSSRIDNEGNIKQGIVLKPGKKWERSLSIYRRMTTMGDAFDYSLLNDESLKTKGRKYRQSVISTMEMQEYPGSQHNESLISRRSTFVSKPNRSTIKIVKDPNASNVSLYSSVLFDDLEGFLNGDCDDTVIELSKLSIGDSDREVTGLDKFHDTSNRIFSARDYVLRRCNQTEPILFDECYPDPVLKNCRKIGEGVYGEVFLWRAGDGRARVMKIVPIAGNTKVNGEEQKTYHEIISEIVIAMELSALRAPIAEIERHFDDGKGTDTLDLHSVQNATDVFNEVLAVRLVHGPYPSRLLDLWELYDETRGSENDSPAALPAGQHYLVLELANAGQDLESYQFTNAEQAYALFKQIALGLAVAEEELQFEHRDLHWGNVLIAPTDQKQATFVLRGRVYRVGRCGVAATLIDYSLSRAARGPAALYNDLANDDALFEAVGDYQFEVYRLMRDKLGNDWKNYEPYTNILWLHYTVDKMITALRYTRTNTKIHKHYIAKLKEIKNRVLDYGSATQFVLTDNEF